MRNKVIISGATGYIGAHVAKHYAEQNWDVHVIARKSSRFESCENFLNQFNVHLYDGTLNRMTEIFREVKADLVIHLASYFVAEHQPGDVDKIFQSNLLFGMHILEAMRVSGVKKLVNTSTGWEHYQDEEYNPVCLYAASKKAFSDLIKYYIEAEGFQVVTLKLFETYGPNDQRNKLFHLLTKAALSDEPIAMSPGEQEIDLVYIEDVERGFFIAGSQLLKEIPLEMEEYVLNSGETMKLRQVIDIFNEISDKKVNVLWGQKPYRRREVMTPWSKGKRLSNWTASVSLREGIKRTLYKGR